MATERLDRLLSRLGYCSRSQVKKFLPRVTCAGLPVVSADLRVDPSEVRFEGEPLDPDPLWILMHKPLGLTCSHQDRGDLVFDLFPERYRNRRPILSSIGRLDKETSGVLLFTTDGQALHRLTSPKFKVEKVYRAHLREAPTPESIEQLSGGGLHLPDDPKPLLPCKIQARADHQVEMTLVEGRYHQVRRMWELVGNHVERLHRERFGELDARRLESGEFRLLSALEVQQLLTPSTRS